MISGISGRAPCIEKRRHTNTQTKVAATDQSQTRTWPVIHNSYSLFVPAYFYSIHSSCFFFFLDFFALIVACCVLNGGRTNRITSTGNTVRTTTQIRLDLLLPFVFWLSSRDHHERTFDHIYFLIYFYFFVFFLLSFVDCENGRRRLVFFLARLVVCVSKPFLIPFWLLERNPIHTFSRENKRNKKRACGYISRRSSFVLMDSFFFSSLLFLLPTCMKHFK